MVSLQSGGWMYPTPSLLWGGRTLRPSLRYFCGGRTQPVEVKKIPSWNELESCLWCLGFWKYAVFSGLFVGGGFGSSLTVGIKACRRRCVNEELAGGGPGACGSAPPSRCRWSRVRGESRPPGLGPPADRGRRGGLGPAGFQRRFPLSIWNSEVPHEAGAQMWLCVRCHAFCGLLLSQTLSFRVLC